MADPAQHNFGSTTDQLHFFNDQGVQNCRPLICLPIPILARPLQPTADLWVLLLDLLPAFVLCFLSLFLCRRTQAEIAVDRGPIDEADNPPTPWGHSVVSVLKLYARQSMSSLLVTGLMPTRLKRLVLSSEEKEATITSSISTLSSLLDADSDENTALVKATGKTAMGLTEPKPEPRAEVKADSDNDCSSELELDNIEGQLALATLEDENIKEEQRMKKEVPMYKGNDRKIAPLKKRT
ncbi:hypothetical protein Daus18300_005726 [Diaporthe australafricana]|uniref:Uncharacterized protein n=1 Tax=Diaporthe australafricana TaxID=127596 RepID=A0ABR3WZT5_9PEZI